MSTTTPTTAHVTGWDRAVVIALGAAGCALSYDALQQMAVAIHVRGFLTYLFPLVIDGFISYGVRALLVLRDAPLRARIYVWTLFGAATGASLWANALHAIRLNQQSVASGLRLGDTVVAVLSTIAPLALAGAVHLYILIARGQVNPADPDSRRDRVTEADLGQVAVEVDLTERPGELTGGQDSIGHLGAGQLVSRPVTASENPPQLTPVNAVSLTEPPDLGGHPEAAQPVTSRPAVLGQVTAPKVSPVETAGQPVTGPQVTDRESADRRTDLDTEELLAIAREAVEAEDKLTRRVVAQAIRGQQIPLSSATLTQLMAQLRDQHGQPVTAGRS
ncbi:DUF2637 domain-containing protein [Streptomyces sp. LS1784]|uniref:DUF2637 domain-containing protein n=1 Tax=Streptomyces sp. LS1784 TaxID=2851533 RepID=UPI001CC9A62B|nr:DUF2637 domain-containing protein [Streptomyces sp. LS1784]